MRSDRRPPKAVTGFAVDEPAEKGEGAPAYVQVSPTELVLKPGQTVKLHARLFDDKGRFLREEPAHVVARGPEGHGDRRDVRRRRAIRSSRPGLIKATVGALTGEARARVVRPLPWNETFESYADGAVPPGWVNAMAGKFSVATLDGQKVLQKAPDDTIFKRVRVFIGPVDWSNYTFEADVRVATRRRQMGDIGITAQRYSLVLYGNIAAAEDRAVGAGDRADGDGAVRLEGRHVVPPEAAGREPSRRPGARARQGVADGRSRAGGVDDRQGRSDRQPPGRARACSSNAQFGAYLDNLTIMANQ